ncbi:MAG: iron chaperone [Candidatus Limnocylindrales bacterium]
MPRFESVDAYIASFSPEVRAKLESVRQAIHRAVPGSDEAISYDIPAFRLNGRYFLSVAGWKRHISLYPIPAADAELDRELEPHKAGRGTLQFSLREPMPLELVSKVATLLAEQRARASGTR